MSTSENADNNTSLLSMLVKVLKKSFHLFSSNDPMRMAGATAFFTTFALPPILIIITQLLGLIFNENIGRKIFSRLASTIGRSSTEQVLDTLNAFKEMAEKWYITFAGVLILLFIATNLFNIIKNSINQLWKIKVVEKRNLRKRLKARWHSLVIIIITAILFIIAILGEGIQAYLSDVIEGLSPGLANYLKSIFNYISSVIIVTIWFSLLFKYLPDGDPEWIVAISGALFTSILFNIGKFILRLLLIQSNLDNLYGASASIVLLLLFVFYSSLMLYFGAAFTKAWADFRGKPIIPKPGAVRYRWSEIHDE